MQNLVARSGSILGKADLLSKFLDEADQSEAAKPKLVGPFDINSNQEVLNAEGQVVANLPEGSQALDLEGKSIKDIDSQGNLKGANGSILGKADLVSNLFDKADEAKPELVGPFDINSQNEVLNAEGQVVANLPEGEVRISHAMNSPSSTAKLTSLVYRSMTSTANQ